DRVEDRAPRAGRPQRREGRPVLDDPPLAAVVPDEVRDVVDVGMRPRHDRREADRRQRGERRGRVAVLAVLGEEAERGCLLLERAPHDLRGAECSREAAEPPAERLVPVLERETETGAGRGREEDRGDDPAANRREGAGEEHAEPRADPDEETDPVPLAHAPSLDLGFGGRRRGKTRSMADDAWPLLVFFYS